MNYNSEGSVSHINGVFCSFLTILTGHRSSTWRIVWWSLVKSLKSWLRTPTCSFENISRWAADEDTPLTEWAPKIDVSMPEASSKDLSHIATVLEDTALCGLIIATSKLVSLPQRGCVLASYSFRVRTGQSLLPPGREGKKKVLIFDVDLDCLTRMFR